MERHQIIEMMRELKLAGMRGAFDEILANGLKRQHSIPQILGGLLQAEIAEKQARSIKYQVAIARLPLALRRRTPVGFLPFRAIQIRR
jgi:IstB-like ATP binding protein